ncbi:RNA polymerase subunit sigma-24 [Pandoraea iniqua]|uniref:RNA polymerase subunit sigma-24 n=1 Tax=Pandoraea iniqua TaxID=2508288 RepID=A0A5E4XNC7_9BURK|nr:sigma-70 family RNA polymerase sigma factor [Pandoraea iniqua]VVE37784.1 RNA polymerase subunit sigma-24 [Pandoraea iniqua]
MTDTPGTTGRPGDVETRRAGASDPQDVRREHLNQTLLQVGQGSQAAFGELYKLTSSHLFGVILRMVREPAEAEDMLQDVFVTVWRRADAYDATRGNAMTWLIALARNRTIDRLRQHREAALDDEQALDIPDDNPSPAALAEASEDRQRLEACMEKLEGKQRAAVREAFFSGATYSELAAHLRVPLGTLKSWIRRSLMQLKVCLEQ